MSLLEQVEKTLRDCAGRRRGERLMVAVSGGVDSMVMLHVLQQLSCSNRWQLSVAHFNHQLRGRSSTADEQLVRRTARALGLKIAVGRGNVRAFAARHNLSVEMAARQLRHEFLALAARKLKVRTLTLAHHADDQVELFFLRLIRGAGSEGLSGMKLCAPSPVDSHLQVLRPLIEIPKRTIEDFARANQIEFREDASNAKLDILRNRVRRELLPQLKRQYQPAIEVAVLRAMNILTAEAEFICATARDWLRAESPSPFPDLAVAVQRQVLLQELQHLQLPADFEMVEALRLRPGAPVNLGPGVRVSRSPEGLLRIDCPQPQEFSDRRRVLKLRSTAGRVRFEDVTIEWRFTAGSGARQSKEMPAREVFDAAVVGPNIVLRHWQPGDRFQPIGLKSAAKLQDLFTNQKIPAELRRKLIVAAQAGGEIFWVEGLRIGEVAKLRPETRRRLIWNWRRRG